LFTLVTCVTRSGL